MQLVRATLTSSRWVKELIEQSRLSLTFHFTGLTPAVGQLKNLGYTGEIRVDGGPAAIVTELRPFPEDSRGVAMVAIEVQLSNETAKRVEDALTNEAGRAVAVDLSNFQMSVGGFFGQRVTLPMLAGLNLRRGIEIGFVHRQLVNLGPTPLASAPQLDRKVVRA